MGWERDTCKTATAVVLCRFQEKKHEKSHKDNSAWLLHVWPQWEWNRAPATDQCGWSTLLLLLNLRGWEHLVPSSGKGLKGSAIWTPGVNEIIWNHPAYQTNHLFTWLMNQKEIRVSQVNTEGGSSKPAQSQSDECAVTFSNMIKIKSRRKWVVTSRCLLMVTL